MTFSIVAYDGGDGRGPAWGLAVQSKFFSVGALCLHARAGAGAIAIQGYSDLEAAEPAMERLGRGESAPEVVEALVADDEAAERRQFGVIDAEGRPAAWTGEGCTEHASHVGGDGFTCQGNCTAAGTDAAMAEAFRAARDAGRDFDRALVEALRAGQGAGGDERGRQSAALLIVRAGAGRGTFGDRLVDLRVDDGPRPIDELERLLDLHELFLRRPDDFVPIDEVAETVAEIVDGAARRLGRKHPREDVAAWLYEVLWRDNLAHTLQPEHGLISRRALDLLAAAYVPAD